MQARILFILSILSLLALFGCSKPGVVIKQFDPAENYSPSSWEKIAVLPFSGNKNFQRTASEWFSFHLQKQQRYSIITPTFAEIEITNKGMNIPDKGFSIEEARQAARFLDADAVILGDVETQKRAKSPVKISIQLIDVQTGEQIATHTVGYPSMVFFWDNFQEYVKLATDVAGRDFLKVFQGLADGKWVEPLPENSLSNKNTNDI